MHFPSVNIRGGKYFGPRTHIDEQVGRNLGELERLAGRGKFYVIMVTDYDLTAWSQPATGWENVFVRTEKFHYRQLPAVQPRLIIE